MIRMQMGGEVLCIIEPGNLKRLCEDDRPLQIDLAAHPGAEKVTIIYTPDGVFVQDALTALMGSGGIHPEQLSRVLAEARRRAEVVR